MKKFLVSKTPFAKLKFTYKLFSLPPSKAPFSIGFASLGVYVIALCSGKITVEPEPLTVLSIGLVVPTISVTLLL